MRITILSPPPNWSGGERVIAIYAKHLSNRGHSVDIVCNRFPKGSIPHRLAVFFGLKPRSWKDERVGSHYESYNVAFRLADHTGPLTDLDVPDADIVMATFWTTAHWAVNLSSRKGKPVYLLQHDEARVFEFRKEVEETYQAPMLQICVSQWIADSVRSRHPAARQVVIRNSVEPQRFPRSLDLAARKARIGFLQSATGFKRSDLALTALEIARKQMPSITVEALGEKLPPDMPDWVVGCQRPDPAALAQLYGRCRAWLFPSDIEGFGLPILEAMACGTPVIGTPAGAALDLLAGGAGILVPYNNPKAMSDAILTICQMSNAHWQEMSDASYRSALVFTWENATDLLEQALLELVSPAS